MSQTVNVKVTVDLKYVDWSDPEKPTGQLQWDVDPTRVIVPEDSCTLKWELDKKNHDGADVVFASQQSNGVEGIVWKDSGSNPGTPSRSNDTTYEVEYDNSNATSSTDWGYTINVVVSKGNFAKVLSYDPDVENESPTDL
jgi:hypothetical protein